MGALRQIAERIVRPVAMPDAHHGALDGLQPVCRMGLPVAQHPANTSPVCASSTGGRVRMLGPVDIEETVHALFLDLCHLEDWLVHDSALSLDEDRVKDFVGQHPNSLVVCRVAPTRKHMVRDSPGALIAQITSIESGPKGQTATIGYRRQDQPAPTIEVDALALAQRSERDWRESSPRMRSHIRLAQILRTTEGVDDLGVAIECHG
jgi:hypothetical protein